MTKLHAVAAVSLAVAACAPSGAAQAPSPAQCQLNQASENPLHDASRIVDMQVVTKKGRRGNALGDVKQGIAIVVRPERGLTLEWLSHVVACDAASPHTAEPANAAADPACLLALPTAQTAVDSTQGHLVVYVRYTDPKSMQRAVQLVSQFRGANAG
jgi:hypothetical protein